ncbi:polysaccharide deacetylase family protein [Methylohalobius crimeensis]|uniref:polysaccharide deacetylase family protein n=1 Tax=Methylohalobius crimeensis TaxID=244365 RepID=UPI0003B6A368|nr:polysaccharide deacetylase family protein [Methylohalobius crimeensis]
MSRALILMYHQVDTPSTARERRFCVAPGEFRRQMDWLKQAGYRPVGMEAIVSPMIEGGRIPDKAVHITFDDGFVGVLEHAWPILQERGIPATLFPVSGYTGRTNEWMRHSRFPRRALLSAAQLRLLAEEGMAIGSHTRTHARLTEIQPEQAETEISRSKNELEELLQTRVSHFAYPYGRFNRSVRDMVERAGYRSACSTLSGFNRSSEDPFQIRRIDVFGTDRLWEFRQKIEFGTNEASRVKPFTYYAGRLGIRLGRGLRQR